VRGLERLIDRLADELHVGSELAGRLELRHRRRLGHEHGARDAASPGRIGDGLGVVTGARGHDSCRAGVPQGGDLRQRPAELERAGALQVLGLERDRRAGAVTQSARAQQRRRPDDAGDRRERALDVSRGDFRGISQRAPPQRPSRPARPWAGQPRQWPRARADRTRRTTGRPRSPGRRLTCR